MLERSGNPARGGASSEIYETSVVRKACQTDSMEVIFNTSRNSSVSNVRNSLLDNCLEEK